ncbi:hypothetical protein [Streptomyces sp. CC210A]|uniref:hypothetical protein n=1 Tax=Streptomyces sp. CC210A TaxID=2898184 RepID=UPI001F2B53D0|nr:hypothetical protein [Streptomyces sp. CC210A]
MTRWNPHPELLVSKAAAGYLARQPDTVLTQKQVLRALQIPHDVHGRVPDGLTVAQLRALFTAPPDWLLAQHRGLEAKGVATARHEVRLPDDPVAAPTSGARRGPGAGADPQAPAVQQRTPARPGIRPDARQQVTAATRPTPPGPASAARTPQRAMPARPAREGAASPRGPRHARHPPGPPPGRSDHAPRPRGHGIRRARAAAAVRPAQHRAGAAGDPARPEERDAHRGGTASAPHTDPRGTAPTRSAPPPESEPQPRPQPAAPAPSQGGPRVRSAPQVPPVPPQPSGQEPPTAGIRPESARRPERPQPTRPSLIPVFREPTV